MWFPDSIATPEDYAFAWDSTSTQVAICRPGVAQKGSRVLVLKLQDRSLRILATVKSAQLSKPHWLLDGTLIVTKESQDGGGPAADLRFPAGR